MKKILLAGLIGFVPILLTAQAIALNATTKNNEPVASATFKNAGSGSSGSSAATAKAIRKSARENRQFSHTTKVFNRDFENASGVTWTSTKSEFIASFTKDNVHTIAWYGKSGSLLYSMLSYGADKLPKREQRIIGDEYEDYKITSVDEVHENDIVVYVVHLENASDIKLVTVCDGATNVYREYKKS
jgi:hypothetical protein